MTAAAIDASAARCSSCTARVLWVKTEARGQSMPLDPDPHPEGNVVMIEVPQTRHQVARVVPPSDLPAEQPAYRSHFVTCPKAKHHRGPRRQRTFDKACAFCSWSMAGLTLKSVEQAFDKHYTEEHLDRCQSCGERLLWIRAEHDMRILALDPEPVEVIGQFVLVAGRGQVLAREIAPGLRGLRVHQCPTEGATIAPR